MRKARSTAMEKQAKFSTDNQDIYTRILPRVIITLLNLHYLTF